jgi:biotin-(acetyl-CoA carboxylase) ligase
MAPNRPSTFPRPRLPPAYRLVAADAGDDTVARACASAAAGAEPGTLVWAPRRDRLDCAVVLSPDRSLIWTRPVLLVGMLGLAGALGGLGPPRTRVTFGWPDRVEVNGAVAGGARFAAPSAGDAAGVPAWAVVGVALDVLGDPDDDAPGRHPDRTTLLVEGFGELDPGLLLESFARHFLSWMGRWQEDGFVSVRDAWLWYYAAEAGQAVSLDEAGTLTLVAPDGTETRRELARAALEPTWALPEPPKAVAAEGRPL